MKPQKPVHGVVLERFTDSGKLLSLKALEMRFCFAEKNLPLVIDLPDENGAVAVHRTISIPLKEIYALIGPYIQGGDDDF